MDTKTLAAGQRVWMQSGDKFKEATVTEVTEEYIAAKPVSFEQNERPWIIHFQRDGNQFTVKGGRCKDIGNLGVYDWVPAFGGWLRDDPRPLCTEFGPWKLVLE